MIGRRHHTLAFHALDDSRGAVVADLQIALDEAGRAFAFAGDQRDRLVVELIALAFLAALARQARTALLALGIVGDRVDVGRLTLRAQMAHDLFDLAVAHERTVHARDLAAARHVEHVAL